MNCLITSEEYEILDAPSIDEIVRPSRTDRGGSELNQTSPYLAQDADRMRTRQD